MPGDWGVGTSSFRLRKMDIVYWLIGLLPLVGAGAGYLLKKEVDRKYILELEVYKAEQQAKQEAYRAQQQNKQKVEIIAELLAEWISRPEELTQLNKLTYQAFLWLPDDIAVELSRILSHHGKATSVPDIIVKVRKHLLNDTVITANDIITFRDKGYMAINNNITPTKG